MRAAKTLLWPIRLMNFKLAPPPTHAIEPHPAATFELPRLLAGVAELVDAPDLGSGGASHGGSSPSARTSFQDGDANRVSMSWVDIGRAACAIGEAQRPQKRIET